MLDLTIYMVIAWAYGTKHGRNRIFYAYVSAVMIKLLEAMILPPTEIPSAALWVFT